MVENYRDEESPTEFRRAQFTRKGYTRSVAGRGNVNKGNPDTAIISGEAQVFWARRLNIHVPESQHDMKYSLYHNICSAVLLIGAIHEFLLFTSICLMDG